MADLNHPLAGIPFSDLIGKPLRACISAQEQAAYSTWSFINQVCLTEKSVGRKEAITVSFTFLSDGQLIRLRVPLLTIVPVPFLSIDWLDISFRAKVHSVETTVDSRTQTALHKMRASYSYKRDLQAANESCYNTESAIDVKIRAAQDHMPSGLSKVMSLMERGVVARSAVTNLQDPQLSRLMKERGLYNFDPFAPSPSYSDLVRSAVSVVCNDAFDTALLASAEALRICHQTYPFRSMVDFSFLPSLLALEVSRLDLQALLSFDTHRLLRLHFLTLYADRAKEFRKGGYCPRIDFSLMRKLQVLNLGYWKAGFIPYVDLSDLRWLESLTIVHSEHQTVDISRCCGLKHLKIEQSKVGRLIVSSRFDKCSLLTCSLGKGIRVVKKPLDKLGA